MSQLGELGFGSSSAGRGTKQKRGRGCVAVLLSLVVLAGIGWFAWDRGLNVLTDLVTVPDYSGTGKGEVSVQVKDGDSIGEIAAALTEHDVVKSAEAFEQAAGKDSRALGIQPGHYQLRTQMSGKAALELILDPKARVLERATVSEGRRLSSVLDVLEQETGIAGKEFESALKDDEVDLPEYAEGEPEGFLFPATYDIDPSTTASSLLQDMVNTFEREAEEMSLSAEAKEAGFTEREIVTIASLIQAEARRPADFGKVSRVIYNRLDSGMKLQLDSTTNYVVGSDTVSTTAEERAIRDPYNTYWAEGLPPGPINSPGTKALDAALNPTDGDWLFFVTVDLETGETKFAETNAQHDEYAAEYRQWCAANEGKC